MNTTGIFTIHSYKIDVEKLNTPIYLIPFGDVHRSSPACCIEKWNDFLEWAEEKENTYFIGMGDYDDLASASERIILTDKKLHESSLKTLDGLYKYHTDRFYDEIKFMKGRCIGLMEGNHYAELQSGITTTQYLCEKLECKYLGVSTFVRLQFRYNNFKSVIDIWGHHGKGAARLIGGSLNTVEQMAESADANIYLMGHDHKKSIAPGEKLVLQSGNGSLRLKVRKMLFGRTGSFLKGYEPEVKSYIVDRGFKPTVLGVIKIEMTPKRKRTTKEESFYIDLHGSV